MNNEDEKYSRWDSNDARLPEMPERGLGLERESEVGDENAADGDAPQQAADEDTPVVDALAGDLSSGSSAEAAGEIVPAPSLAITNRPPAVVRSTAANWLPASVIFWLHS